jgi:hypothetical protein
MNDLFLDIEALGRKPGSAIVEFMSWLGTLGEAGHQIDDIWTWGITYDIPLLAPVFDHYAGSTPWKYHAVSDARSFWKRAFPGIKHAPRPHHALEDCRHGIRDLVSALSQLTSSEAEAERVKKAAREFLHKWAYMDGPEGWRDSCDHLMAIVGLDPERKEDPFP